MRWILSFFLCINILFSHAQRTAAPLQSKTNRIIIHSKDTGMVLINKVTDLLLEKGYSLENGSKNIVTKQKPIPGWTYLMYISVFVKDSVCFISGQLHADKLMLGSDFVSSIVYTKHKSSFFFNAWKELQDLADGLKPLKIEYEVLKD